MLKELSKKHDYWYSVALNISKDSETAKDLVQDMYLKIHEVQSSRKIKDIDWYCIAIIRNSFFKLIENENKTISDYDFSFIECDAELKDGFDDDELEIYNRANELPFFHRELLKESFDKSYRQIEKEYGIHYKFAYDECIRVRKEVLGLDFDKLYNNKRNKRNEKR